MHPTVIAVGKKTNYIFNRYNFIEDTKVEEGSFLKSRIDGVHPYDYHLANVMKVLLKRWSLIKFTVFFRTQLLKKTMTRKISG